MTDAAGENPETSGSDDENLAEGSLLSHLIELRSRLLKIAASVVGIFILLLPWAKDLFAFASKPIREAVPGGQLIAIGVPSPLLAPFKLTLYVALFIAMPIVLYQIWAFVAPGLYRKEKRFAVPLLGSSIILFYLGVAFAYFVVFPLIFTFFAQIAPDTVEVQPDISEFLDFIMTIFFAFGLAFEVPIATVLVVWTGLTTPQKMAKARPYVFLGAFVLGMFLTPPDMISQTLLAVPIYLLFELGIIMSRFFVGKREDETEEAAQT